MNAPRGIGMQIPLSAIGLGGMSPPVSDAPSAEPMQDIQAQLGDAMNPSQPRKAVYMSAANLKEHKVNLKKLPTGMAAVQNIDGQGGVLIATNEDAEEALARIESGEPREKVIGEMTLSGSGKPNTDNPVAVQQREGDAVTAETAVDGNDPAAIQQAMSAYQQPGRDVQAMPAADSIGRRLSMLGLLETGA